MFVRWCTAAQIEGCGTIEIIQISNYLRNESILCIFELRELIMCHCY